MTPLVLGVAMSALLAACASRTAPDPSPAPAPPVPADAGLHVTLVWAAPVDLDLYVTDPRAETLYFGNNPTRAGARLERDARCATRWPGEPSVEAARVPSPVAGRYRIGVDFIDACRSTVEAVPFRVAVDLGGRRREAEGSVRRGEFKVIVLEFSVGEDGALR